MPDLDALRDTLVAEGTANLSMPRTHVRFTGNDHADDLLNDLEGMPHAFLFACLVDRQVPAETAWLVPSLVRDRLGSLEMDDLIVLSDVEWVSLFRNPSPAHRMPETMADVLHRATQRLVEKYDSDASAIWSGCPSSSPVVRAFLAFHGVGPKIASMGANILVRHFHVPMKDYRSIDISADTHIVRVMARLGYVDDDASNDEVIYAARELHPEFPGIFDLALWDVGRSVCRPNNPRCSDCRFRNSCGYSESHTF